MGRYQEKMLVEICYVCQVICFIDHKYRRISGNYGDLDIEWSYISRLLQWQENYLLFMASTTRCPTKNWHIVP